MPLQHKESGNGLTDYQAAGSELPEPLRNALYRSLAKARLTENDPLWWFNVGQADLLKAFLDDWRARQDLEIRELAKALKYVKSPETKPSSVLGRIALAIGIAALLLALGFLGGVLYVYRQADARVDRVVFSQPASNIAAAALASHGGSISIGPIGGPDGRQAKGIIIRRGDLKQDASTDGAVLLTLP